jgi:hypothetical protein
MTPSPYKQRRAEQPEPGGHAPEAPRRPGRAATARQQGQDAALAVVVGAQDERQVLEDHHQRQRPEHQRQDAEDVAGVAATPCSAVKHSLTAYSGEVPMSP